MPWNELIDWEVGQLVTAADMNAQVRDNLGHLLERNAQVATSTATYSTSSTSFTALTSVLTVRVEGSQAEVLFNTSIWRDLAGSATNYSEIALFVDGAQYGTALRIQNGAEQPTGLGWIVTGLSSGVDHTFGIRYRRVTGTTCDGRGYDFSVRAD